MRAGEIIEGKYELVRMIGEGGMGEVWEARHRVLGRRVALKFLHPELTADRESNARFLREAQAAAGLGSDHIVNVTDIGESADGVPYLVMEFLDGVDLRNLIFREKQLETGRAVRLTRQICVALAAAHQKNIIHRDLKPENLVVLQLPSGEVRERIKVLDFGIAKFHDLRLTATGIVMGTPSYMAPEQAMAVENLDHRVDLYATGSILYEMLTGRPPFQGLHHSEILMQLVTTEPRPPRDFCPDLSEELEAVVLRAMAKDPARRYGTMEELAEALRPFAEGPARAAEPRGAALTESEHLRSAPPVSRATGAASDIPFSETLDDLSEVMGTEPTLLAGTTPPVSRAPEPLGENEMSAPTLIAPKAFAPASEGTQVAEPAPPPLSRGETSPRQAPPSAKRRLGLVAIGLLVVVSLFGLAAVALFGPWGLFGRSSGSQHRAPQVEAPGRWVVIKGGRFTMGAPFTEMGRDGDETPHIVDITRDFYLRTTEVTQGDFLAVMGYNPSQMTGCGATCPVENVTWHEAAVYCNALSLRESLSTCYQCSGAGRDARCVPRQGDVSPSACPGYRLPTEAEWERAARADHAQATYAGDLSSTESCESPHPILDRIGWFCGNSGGVTHPVGQLQPNRWLLQDMLGNVWEWCHDWHGPLAEAPAVDPAGAPFGTHRVMRGGAYSNSANLLRAAVRGRGQPENASPAGGFRPARTIR
jgi:serine/threonine protein kinase